MGSGRPADFAGRTVVVTRAAEQSGSLQTLLEAKGARVVLLPVIRVDPPASWDVLDRALAGGPHDAVLIGSIHAARFLAERARALGVRIDAPIACVGEKTKRAIEASPDLAEVLRGERLVPETYRSEGMLALLEARFVGSFEGRRFLLPRAREGRELLAEELSRRGATVDACEAYRIVPSAPIDEESIASAEAADALTFLSGETLGAFLVAIGEARARRILERAIVAVIGPVAAARAKELGVRVDVVPPEATSEALVESLAERLAMRA